jgi:hypothetical protein
MEAYTSSEEAAAAASSDGVSYNGGTILKFILFFVVLSLLVIVIMFVLIANGPANNMRRPYFQRSFVFNVSNGGTLYVIVDFNNYALDDNVRQIVNDFIQLSWDSLTLQDSLRILHDEVSDTGARNVRLKWTDDEKNYVMFHALTTFAVSD